MKPVGASKMSSQEQAGNHLINAITTLNYLKMAE